MVQNPLTTAAWNLVLEIATGKTEPIIVQIYAKKNLFDQETRSFDHAER